ncbi:MAG TPA: cytochrome c [Anaerolineales bacterium]
MSTSLSLILKRLALVFLAGGLVLGVLMVFSYDIIKIDWISFMEIQPSYKPMENPLPVPERSIPIEGPVSVPNMGAPANPVQADEVSVARGAELFNINCVPCHGADGKGTGPVAPFLQQRAAADLTSPVIASLSDGAIFLTISNGKLPFMIPMNENLTVRERWDVVNYIRTLQTK